MPAVVLLAIFVLTCLLSRGTARGDEGDAIRFAALARTGGWVALLRGPEGALAAHRMFWAGEKYLLDDLWTLLLPVWLYAKPLVHDAVLTLDGSLFMLIAAVIAWLFVARRHDRNTATLSLSCLLLGSSAISLFVGGSIECMMLLMVAVLTVTLAARPLARGSFALILACSAGLIACKVYALIFLLPLSLLIPDWRRRFCFALFVTIIAIAWLAVPALVGHGGGAISFYLRHLTPGSALAVLGRAIDQFISFGFGLIWCFPLLGIALAGWRGNRRALAIKAAAVLPVILLLAFFPFSYGEGAAAGPRYSVPFLMVFLPEVADGVARLRSRGSIVLLAIPLAVLLFLPAIDYHNSLINRWINKPINAINWFSDDPSLQPGVMAWRVVAVRQTQQTVFHPGGDIPYDVPVNGIIPMTGLSRIIYVLENLPTMTDTGPLSLGGWLWRHHLAALAPWRTLRALLALTLLTWVSNAAWTARRVKA